MIVSFGYVRHSTLEIPLYDSAVSAGFPSPAEDHIEAHLDLNDLAIKNPPATFFVRAVGDSMRGIGIFDGDTLVVDRSIPPKDGRVVIAAIAGELLVKIFREYQGRCYLVATNPKYPNIELNECQDTVFFGVVTTVVHPLTISLTRGFHG